MYGDAGKAPKLVDFPPPIVRAPILHPHSACRCSASCGRACPVVRSRVAATEEGSDVGGARTQEAVACKPVLFDLALNKALYPDVTARATKKKAGGIMSWFSRS